MRKIIPNVDKVGRRERWRKKVKMEAEEEENTENTSFNNW